MKKVISIVITGLLMLLSSCSKEDERIKYESTGYLIGPDLALCICCGGYIITIDGSVEEYRFENLPDESDLDLNELNLPAPVKLNWHMDRECGSINYIIIEDIELNPDPN
ncbi:MAG: hypothetical protein JW894_13435 [Bacteroidales bacterium]|nr:hypothetical protein [Bacteroidales bacterium]